MKTVLRSKIRLLAPILLLFSACGSAQAPAPTEERCKSVGVEARQIWNQSLKNELNFPQKIYAGNLAAGEAEFVVRNLDKFVTDWRNERQLACINDPVSDVNTTGTPTQSPRVQCLERVLAHFGMLIEEIKASKDLEFARITDIFGELSVCADRPIPPALELKLSPFEDDTDSSSDTDNLLWEMID